MGCAPLPPFCRRRAPANPIADELPVPAPPKAKGLGDGLVLGPAVVSPSTHLEAVNARLPSTLDKLTYCAQKARRDTPLLKGSYLIEFEVGQSAKNPPEIVEQTAENDTFETCIISRLWKFGQVSQSEAVSVVLPLHIGPAEQET